MQSFYMAMVTIPLAVPVDLLDNIRTAARETGLSQADVMRQSMKAGLPTVRRRLRDSARRITNVDPYPRRMLDKMYAREDELEGLAADVLLSSQSRKAPS